MAGIALILFLKFKKWLSSFYEIVLTTIL